MKENSHVSFPEQAFRNSEQQQQQPSPGEETQNRKEKGIAAQAEIPEYLLHLIDRQGKGRRLDRIVGREKEIGRVVQILNRRQKTTPA